LIPAPAATSSLDVLHAFFGDDPRAVRDISREDLSVFQAVLLRFFESWQAPVLADDEIRLHFNTRALRGFIPGF
jgi:hypothetical protein